MARAGWLVVALPLQAAAVLGGHGPAGANAEAVSKANGVDTPHASFRVLSTTTPQGTLVREFVSDASGRVFAVTWQGPFMPDLRELLGRYFADFVEAGQPGARGALRVRQPGVVIHSGGHMRAFVGMAYVLALLPPGVDLDDMR